MVTSFDSPDRRAFLRFLAASPLLASAGLTFQWFADLLSAPVAAQDAVLIKSVREALNVMGATAVGIGRAYAWALASFGTEGVETVIELLRREPQVVMAQTGATSIDKISRASLIARA